MTDQPRRDVACVGDNCIDVLRSRGDVEIAGGNAFNVAVALARSARTVAYFGAVGRDTRAELILAAGRAAGVDVSSVERRPGATGVTIVEHGADGERIFVHEDYGVAAEYRIDSIVDLLVTGYRWIHLARQPDVDLLARRALAAVQNGDGARATISYDAGDHTSRDTIARIARHVDVLFVSAVDPSTDAREIAEEAQAFGATLVVVTCGARGAIAHGVGESRWSQSAVQVQEVIDTLGAGDSFIAGFVSSLLDDPDVGRALQAGALAGAEAVARGSLSSSLKTTEAPL